MSRFFKLPRHKQFNYEPRFYDERKEAMEERVKRIKNELGIKDGENSDRPYKSNIKGQIKYNFNENRKARKKSSTQLIVILLLLLFIAYYIFYA